MTTCSSDLANTLHPPTLVIMSGPRSCPPIIVVLLLMTPRLIQPRRLADVALLVVGIIPDILIRNASTIPRTGSVGLQLVTFDNGGAESWPPGLLGATNSDSRAVGESVVTQVLPCSEAAHLMWPTRVVVSIPGAYVRALYLLLTLLFGLREANRGPSRCKLGMLCCS